MKQAIIYSRFSPRPDPDRCTSIEFQESKCRAYCEAKGFDVLALYRDAGLSGKRADNRPGFQQALLHVTKIGGVLVAYDMNRVTRGIIDAVETSNLLAKHHADLAFVTQSIDTTNATGRAFFYFMAVLGQREREQTGERTAAKLQDMREKGLRISGQPRYGYKLNPADPKRVIPDLTEQAVIKDVLRWHEQGRGPREITRMLVKEGYPFRGHSWNHVTVIRIVRRYGPKKRP